MPIAIGLPGGALQRLVVGVASVGVVVLAVAGRSLPRDFRRFFGPIPPALALAGSLVIGVIAVDALRSRGWGSVDAWSHSAAGFTAASMFAVAFAVVAVIADCTLRFDVDINARWPGSLVFYAAGWCKDRDPYTGAGDSVGPLPWRGMSVYPPPEGEEYPRENREWIREWNTRRVRGN